MSEIAQGTAPRAPGRSVRFRLLAIALLPTLVILPLLLGVTIARWNGKFDAALVSKVNGDLTIAHQYLSRILEKTGAQIRTLGLSAAFTDVLNGGDETALIRLLHERRLELGLDFLYLLGKDGAKLQSYYADLFAWRMNADNPMNYALVEVEESGNGSSIPGGIGQGPEGYEGHLTFYVEVPDVEASLQKAESLGGTRLMGPETIMENIILGQFSDPEGNVVGLIQGS